MPSVALLVESFNETEHSSVARLAESLAAAERAAASRGDTRVLLADGGGNPEVAALLARRFPSVQRVPSPDPDYDRAKTTAAGTAGADIVVFLDGDCKPHDGWLDALLEPIAAGRAVASAGFTMYEGGWFARVLSLMDFGFLLPRRERDVGCYASNNAAFTADVLRDTPAPDGDMRCRCFAHAQLLVRKGTPMQLAPAACVDHEAVPLVSERLRRGWDVVTAARVDPELPEARWLRFRAAAAPLFWLHTLRWDLRRLRQSGGDVGLRGAGRPAAVPVIVGVRLLDLVGMVAALRGRPVPGTA